MRSILFFILISAFSFSCGNRGFKVGIQDTSNRQTQDSIAEANDRGTRVVFVERGVLETRGYLVAFTSRYRFPIGSALKKDSGFYFSGSYLLVTNKTVKTSDTLEVVVEDINDCKESCLVLKDLTDSLHVSPLLVQIVTPANDDYYDNNYVGYRNNHLEELFGIRDTVNTGVHLERANDSTLKGLYCGRDEVVDAFENNFPVLVDTRDFKVSEPIMDAQYIGFKTVAIDNFAAHKVINGQVVNSLIDVKSGDSLQVETLYRPRKKVRLLIGDSILIEVKIETVRKKVRPLMVG